MNVKDVKALIIDIPIWCCRNMSNKYFGTILKIYAPELALHHFYILRYLDEFGHQFISEISDGLGIPKSQMTASSNKLIEYGYITRSSDPQDRRKIVLILTPKGHELIANINQEIDQEVENALKLLSQDEIIELGKGLAVYKKLCQSYQEVDNGKRI